MFSKRFRKHIENVLYETPTTSLLVATTHVSVLFRNKYMIRRNDTKIKAQPIQKNVSIN